VVRLCFRIEGNYQTGADYSMTLMI